MSFFFRHLVTLTLALTLAGSVGVVSAAAQSMSKAEACQMDVDNASYLSEESISAIQAAIGVPTTGKWETSDLEAFTAACAKSGTSSSSTTAIPKTLPRAIGVSLGEAQNYIDPIASGKGVRVTDEWCPRGAICGSTETDVAGTKGFSQFVLRLVGGALQFAAAIAVVMLVVAGFRLVIAAGGDEVGAAHTMMKWTIVGLGLIIVSLVIVKNLTKTAYDIIPADATPSASRAASVGATCADRDVDAALQLGFEPGAKKLASTCSKASLQALAGKYGGGSAGNSKAPSSPARVASPTPTNQPSQSNTEDCATASMKRDKAKQELDALRARVDAECTLGGLTCEVGSWFGGQGLYAQVDAKQAEYMQWLRKDVACKQS